MRFSSLFLTLAFPISISFHTDIVHAQAPKTWNFSDPGFKEDAANPLVSPYAAPGGVAASVTIERKAGALRFTNRAGGSFGLKFNVAPFDAAQFPTLNFDFARSPSAKINLFFKVNGAYYGVIFSGPNRVRPGSFLLGSVPNVGEKGRVVLPLRDWLRRFQPKAEKLMVEEMLAGNWDNEGYLLAGIGGNGPGATWSLGSFALQNTPSPAPPARFGAPVWEGNRIVWPLQSGFLDTTKAILNVRDGQSAVENAFENEFSPVSLETALDAKNAVTQRVVFEAGDVGFAPKDGAKIDLTLANGAAGAAPIASATLPFSLGSHAANVPLPRLTWNELVARDELMNSDFEGLDAPFDFALGSNATVQLDPMAPFNGQKSLQFYNPRTASPFDASFQIAPFDAALLPILTFAYRSEDRLRVDFRLLWEGKPYVIRFSDRDGGATKLGEIENIPDGNWHRAILPLYDWMKRSRPDATNFKIDSFGVADDGWKGNARGVKWNIDDFRAAPQQTTSLRASVTLRDVAGVSAVSYFIDQKDAGDVDRTPEGGPKLDISLAGRAAGLYWLHLRAQNGAGAWSNTAHFPFVVG